MVFAATVAQPIAGAHRTFTQQMSGTFEIPIAILRVDPFNQGPRGAISQCPAEQRQQAVTEKRWLQRTFVIALHVDHCR
ncbi:hypothetical protein D3C84_928490 [compost metagenome]